jgi:hypothetical protein
VISIKSNLTPRPILTAAEAESVGKTAVVFNDAALPHHEFSKLFPMVQGEQFNGLVKDIRENGLREPIILYEDAILDGRNRYAACADAGVEPRFEPFTGTDPLAFVISRNLHRRHLTVEERAEIAARLPRVGHGGDRSKTPPDALPLDKRAELLNVSPRTVERMQTVVDHGVAELVEKVKSREVPITTAAAIAKQPPEEQRTAVAAPKPQKAKATPKPKAAEPWPGPALIRSFRDLVEEVRGREAEAARFLRDQYEDEIDALILLADGFAAVRREPEGEERAPFRRRYAAC